MKNINLFFYTFLTIIMVSVLSYAQEGNYYTVTTWQFSIPQDGSNAEFDKIMKEWNDKIVSKNDKIISQKALRHRSGSDGRDWMFITEYASWNDIEAASDMQRKLVEAAWPDKDERAKFFKTMAKYGITHSDEIMIELTNLKK